ncbi:Na/Pi cotransporter family protein [Acidiluteibacter ferrifornacis]|uniref:Na/Pi cotransporter family protein n=1 Tax=Acidiluteibacter ferrifornacis TaxID=2692424 RepID=A0A6N9NKJ4_9FLAO|nr:Na/Pi cotransporter family protein [Acidiluteibacter ferrifornacis]NBG65155.1 Na/Pi cotransporter family protein [Acidiluteibacter ferrifornacis]
MDFGLLESLNLLGALGFFIFGMKIMSEGIQKAAGNKLRQILSSMTRNRFLGVFTGFLITLLIQSSSATTVMVVSFANAGLLSLVESIGVIMGANIGTTVTAWLIAFFGFKIKISSFALPIIAIGFPMMFAKKSTLKSVAEVLIGFALLFLGLDALKNSVPDLNQNPEVLSFLATFTDYGILSTILFVLVGTIITIIIQSSSAAMALTLTLLYTDVITFEVAAAMVLGENIGTTITANLAAIVANVHAKRAARAHLIFNVVGVIWMILLFSFFIDLVKWLWVPFQNGLTAAIPDIGSSQEELQLSLFHTVFNIINTLLMVGFVPLIARVVTKMVPSKGDMDEEFHLEYIGTGMMLTTEAAILEAKKEVAKFGKLTKKMIRFIPKLLVETDKKEFKHLLARIKKYEEITDRIESEVSNYLAKVSEGELNSSASERIRSMLSIINDLERIGDVCYQMSKAIERKSDKKVWFTPEQRQNLKEMFDKVDQASDLMVKNLEQDYDLVQLAKANELEKEINKLRNKIRKEHLVNIETGEYNFASGIIYNDLFSSVERLGDHIINVSEAVAGEV